MTINAIETSYQGYRFRSRLEARWAVFFDTLGIRYKYEEYGFEQEESGLPGEPSAMIRWLPDFYLPDHALWVEVKGGSPSQADAWKMACLLDYGSPLAFFDESACEQKPRPQHAWVFKNGKEVDPVTSLYREMGGELSPYSKFCPGLLLLGDVPHLNHGIVIHPFVTHRKGLQRSYGYFESDGRLHAMDRRELGMFQNFYGDRIEGRDCLDAYGSDPEEQVKFFSPDVHAAETRLAFSKVVKAYNAARAARFEHGEQPRRTA